MARHNRSSEPDRTSPRRRFLEADMCEIAFEVGSFHAVGAFYSITHIPPTQQGPLIANIAAWLKPGGMFVASFGSGAADEWDRRMARNHNVLWSQRRSRDAG